MPVWFFRARWAPLAQSREDRDGRAVRGCAVLLRHGGRLEVMKEMLAAPRCGCRVCLVTEWSSVPPCPAPPGRGG